MYLMVLALAALGVFIRYTTYGYELRDWRQRRGGATLRRSRQRPKESSTPSAARWPAWRAIVPGATELGRGRHWGATVAPGHRRGPRWRDIVAGWCGARSRGRWSARSTLTLVLNGDESAEHQCQLAAARDGCRDSPAAWIDIVTMASGRVEA